MIQSYCSTVKQRVQCVSKVLAEEGSSGGAVGDGGAEGLDNLEKEYYTRAMIIGVSQITLHLPDSQSLKDKRQIIKSILARVRNRFEVAIAEVEDQDRWQIAVLGLCCVSNSKQHSEEILERVRRYIEETRPDIVVSNVETEMITW